ncbi:efflux RND transporter permease subunit [Pseudoroseicyclus aestuarii]|uniref:Multidrug efflux pump subunit AcrB n=1 Tax=Pseudoroseicyclus aestuarii TaxID=1795041 RepID=A0A318SWH0_9RHOB|nr:efflux RND transporter permease subunit [Pseudoroseicyclus aestuarii]PYE84739.1 multidrug efflux pump subunit AcrB [Pseudoroseicyclus aestuarii]
MARPDGQPAGGLLSYFTRHGTAANLVLCLMVVAGLFALPRMRAQFFPDVVIDSIDVRVSWDGAGAEDVDAGIVQLLQPAFQAVTGVTETDARASEGSARLRLEFEPNYDMDRAERDVQAAVDEVSGLPDGVDDPVVRRGGWSDTVTDVVVTGPIGVDQLARIADGMVQQLFAQGVTQAEVSGVTAPETLVTVPSLSLIRYDIGLSDVAQAIAQEVSASPAGEAGDARIRTGTARRGADEIAAIVLRQEADGTQLTVGDVARVEEQGPTRDAALFVGADPAVRIHVSRSATGDTIALQSSVEEVARQVRAGVPQGVSVDLVDSRAEEITGRLRLLLDNGAMGLGLVVLLLFLFLSARTAIWVALGIPAAMLGGIALMYAFGMTLNIMSLFALILTLGIVVDDAIVVGEHADFRARQLGEAPATAAETAARRMFLPVFCSTLTTVIAFFGLVTVGGRFGDLMQAIPVTVIIVLIASLVECFVILPNHLRHSVGQTGKPWYDWPSRQVDRGFSWVRDRLFRPFITAVVALRYPVLALAVLGLASQVALYISGDVQWRFFSSPEQRVLTGNFAMLDSAERDDTRAQMIALQQAALDLGEAYEAETGVNPVAYVTAQTGGTAGRGLSGVDSKEDWQLGAIEVELTDSDQRPMTASAFVTRLQQEVQTLPMTEVLSFRSWGAGPGGDAIDIQLAGAEAQTLKDAAEALKTALAAYPEVSGLEDSLAYDMEEMILTLTPQGRALGFTIEALGQELRQRLGGIEAATYPVGTRTASIRVELPEDELTADFLDRTLLRTEGGATLPLADIVTVQQRSGFSSVRRENGVAQISVNGGLDDEDADRASEIMAQIEARVLPQIEADYGVTTRLSGLSEQEEEFLSDARTGLLFCLGGIYLALCWIFGSWTRPVVVMSVIPFGLIGAIWGHALWGIPISMFSIVGMIGMAGIIINDSIVLVTTVDEYSEARGLGPAIIDAATDRLRPVFLTTLTTVIGLAPLMYETSSQAEFLKPTVITLVYGLGFGFVLVLCVVPALLAVQADWAARVRAARRGLRAPVLRLPMGLAAAAALALFVLLIVPALWPAAPWALAALPQGFGAALGLYLGALALILLAIRLAAGLAARRA